MVPVPLRSAHERSSGLTPDERWLAVARAQRAWALQHPSQYLLIYGRTGGTARRIDAGAGALVPEYVAKGRDAAHNRRGPVGS